MTDETERAESDLAAIEEAGVGFDPTTQYLDLDKDEKRRTTALLLAIQGYKELIIKDAAYLREVADMARRDEGPQIRPATMDAMIEAAIKFDCFIAGKELPASAAEIGRGYETSAAEGEDDDTPDAP